MKHTLLVLLLAAVLPLKAAAGKDAPADPLAGAFFPPELIFLARDQIGLTQNQENAFRDRVEKMQAHAEELRVKLERESAALAALVNQEHMDEAATIAQLDKVLDAEREVKHLHVGLGAAIKNLLTSEQQAKLREIGRSAAKGSAAFRQLEEAASKRFAEKIGRVKAGVEKWQSEGRDPSSIAQAMEEKFKPLIDAGKVMEAEAELDRVLDLLKPDAK